MYDRSSTHYQSIARLIIGQLGNRMQQTEIPIPETMTCSDRPEAPLWPRRREES
jgi:hypothetical protein